MFIEGKDIDSISKSAGCEPSDVISVIEDARNLLLKHERVNSKKKIILKKSAKNFPEDKLSLNEEAMRSVFHGAELTTVPLGSVLTMYIDGASRGNPGPAGIGIIILDKEGHQVGKVSTGIGIATNNVAEYTALIRSLKLAKYFQVSGLKVRSDSELIVKQLNGEYKVKNPSMKRFYDEAALLLSELPNVKIEHIPRTQNDKADYLAKKSCMMHEI
jgi:ribonuclease HI